MNLTWISKNVSDTSMDSSFATLCRKYNLYVGLIFFIIAEWQPTFASLFGVLHLLSCNFWRSHDFILVVDREYSAYKCVEFINKNVHNISWHFYLDISKMRLSSMCHFNVPLCLTKITVSFLMTKDCKTEINGLLLVL